MNKSLLLLAFCLVFSACSKIEFVYKENEVQKNLFNKTNVILRGEKIPFVNSVIFSKFGSPNNASFDLEIYVSEKITNISIKENQVSSRVDHVISFNYRLINKNKKCVVFINDQYSRFSFMPKSEGYNFGSDKSLESLYKRNVEDNVDRFIERLFDQSPNSLGNNIENKKCLNEN